MLHSVELSDGDPGIEFTIWPRFCWFVLKTCCHFSLALIMSRTGFYRSWGQWKCYPFYTLLLARLKQINLQWLILLQVHVSCLEGQKWKEEVPSPGVYQHLFLTASWAPSMHHRFTCWQLLFLLNLLVCWKQSLLWKSLSCVTCQWWILASSSLTLPSLGVSTVLIFPCLLSPAQRWGTGSQCSSFPHALKRNCR